MGRKAKEVVEYRTYELSPEFPVLLLDGEEWVISDALSGRQHFHNCLEIGLCHTDSGILRYGREQLPFRAGDISCISHHVPHTTCSAKGAKSRWSYLFVDADRLLAQGPGKSEPYGAERLLNAHLLVNREDSPRLYFLLTELIGELHAARGDSRVAFQCLFYLLMRELIHLSDSKRELPRQGNSFALQPALDHIYDSYAQPIKISELADMCHLSPTHFRRMFETIVGMPPLGFINATRINRARELLIITNDTILSIAERVGFGSLSSFNRCFLRLTGASPRAYRSPQSNKDALPRGERVLKHSGWLKPDETPAYVSEEVKSSADIQRHDALAGD